MRISSAPAVVSTSTNSSLSRAEEQMLRNAPPEMQAQLKAQMLAQRGASLRPNFNDGFFPSPFRRQDAATRGEQGQQLHEIADGVRNGSITESEAKSLLEEQKAISEAQRQAMSDGHLSLGERFKLAMMQNRAESHIQRAEHNFNRDFFAAFDGDAQVQADQIDQIANGRTNGNITNSEAGALLGQQAEIAGDRNNGGLFGQLVTALEQNQAQNDIDRHSRPGTQLDFKLPFYLRNLSW